MICHLSQLYRRALISRACAPEEAATWSSTEGRAWVFAQPQIRSASQRLGKDGTGSWFGAAHVGEPGNVRRTDPAMASPPSSPPQPPQRRRASPGRAAEPRLLTFPIRLGCVSDLRLFLPLTPGVLWNFPPAVTRADLRSAVDPRPASETFLVRICHFPRTIPTCASCDVGL